jgi:hypothetical protein
VRPSTTPVRHELGGLLDALATLGPPSREAYEQLLDQMVG